MRLLLNKTIELLNATRFNDWRYSFIPNIFGNIYLWLFLFNIPVSPKSVLLLTCSLITSVGFAALGYFINEFFDKKDDYLAGKLNKLTAITPLKQFLLLLLILACTFIPWVFLPKNDLSFALMAIQITLFLLYSSPPFRFKKIWLAATIIDSLYAYVVPFVLSSYTYYLFSPETPRSTLISVILTVYMATLFLVGARNITIHNINDVFNDKRLGILTLPRRLGVVNTNAYLKSSIYIEFLLSVALCSLLSSFNLLFLFGTFIVVRQLITYHKKLIITRNGILVNKTIRHAPDQLFQRVFSILFLANLIFHDPIWSFLLVFHLFVFIPASAYKPIISWIVRAKIWLHKFKIQLKHLLSLAINYTIYFVFLLFGVNLIKEKKSAWQYLKTKIAS